MLYFLKHGVFFLVVFSIPLTLKLGGLLLHCQIEDITCLGTFETAFITSYIG